MGLVPSSVVNRTRIDLALLDPDLEPLENVTYAFSPLSEVFLLTFASQIQFYPGTRPCYNVKNWDFLFFS